MLPNQRVEVEAVQQFHDEVERLVVGHAEVVELHRVRRSQVGRRLCLAPEAGHRQLRGRWVTSADRLGTNQLDRRRPGEHAVRRLVDFAHPAAAEQLSELIAAHLARLRDLVAERGDDMRDDHRDADKEVVGIVHQQRVGRGLEVPRASRPGDEHRHRIHRYRNQAGDERLEPGARNDGGKHQDDGADPRDLWCDPHINRHGFPVKHVSERNGGQHHVHQAEIQHHPRIALAASGIEEQPHRERDTERGDRFRRTDAQPLRITVAHRSNGEMTEDRPEDPQPSGNEREDPQPARGVPQEIVGQGARPARATRLRRGGARNGADQARVAHGSLVTCPDGAGVMGAFQA